MITKILSWTAIALALIAMTVSAYFNYACRDLDAPLPKVKYNSTFKLRERHFRKDDPKFSRIEITELKVESVKGEGFKTKTAQGLEQVQSFNLFLPPFMEVSNDPKDAYTIHNSIIGDTLGFFPLEVGKRSFNQIIGSSTDGDEHGKAWAYNYSCQVEKRETIHIQMGSFDTYKVVCIASGTMNFEKVFYYHPPSKKVLLVQIDSANPYDAEMIELPRPEDI